MNENRILIIGGGPAGMETAFQLKQLGLKPIIIEKNDKLGGHLAQWDRLFPAGDDAESLLEKLKEQCKDIEKKLNAKITNITKENNIFHVTLSNGISYNADAIVLCTGFDLFKAEKKQEAAPGGFQHYKKLLKVRMER